MAFRPRCFKAAAVEIVKGYRVHKADHSALGVVISKAQLVSDQANEPLFHVFHGSIVPGERGPGNGTIALETHLELSTHVVFATTPWIAAIDRHANIATAAVLQNLKQAAGSPCQTYLKVTVGENGSVKKRPGIHAARSLKAYAV